MDILYIGEKTVFRRLKLGLENLDHIVTVFGNAEEIQTNIVDHPHDLIVLGNENKGYDSFELVRHFRRMKIKIPILLLLSNDNVENIVSGLAAGADDVQKMTISIDELAARISAMKRRADYDRGKDIIVGDLRLDPIAQKVWQGGVEIGLARREYDLFAYFMRFPGQELTRSMITVDVWEGKLNNFSNIVDVYVNYLRKKLGSNGKVTIQTVRGKGYVLR